MISTDGDDAGNSNDPHGSGDKSGLLCRQCMERVQAACDQGMQGTGSTAWLGNWGSKQGEGWGPRGFAGGSFFDVSNAQYDKPDWLSWVMAGMMMGVITTMAIGFRRHN